MRSTVDKLRFRVVFAFLLFGAATLCGGSGPRQGSETPSRDRLMTAAREIMQSARFCGLVTVDESGRPQARAMDPFSPEDDFVVWLGTRRGTRKVEQIRNDPRVTLFYLDPGGSGYVTISGDARLVDDPKETSRRWKEGWEAFYPDREKSYLLIAVEPRRMEVVRPADGIDGDPETWIPPSVDFGAATPK